MQMRNTIITKLFVPFLAIFTSVAGLSAQETASRFHVQGRIIDGKTKLGIKRIPITVLPFKKVVEADSKGTFKFNMPKGKISFLIDYYPFDKQVINLDLHADTTLLIELHSPFSSQYLEEVEVTVSNTVTEKPASLSQINNNQLKTLPAIIGERDILKALTMTSGVTSSSEGAADIQVRGGVHGQNLYLLDGIPMYSTQHLFGFLSTYNPTIIQSASLYKSDFPTEYGGKLSSVLNVITEDANTTKFKGEAEIGLLSSKASLNIPIVKDKLALALAGRISNYSLLNLASIGNKETQFLLYFDDINANLLYKLSEKDKLKLTFFTNNDGMKVTQTMMGASTEVWIVNNQRNLGLNWYRKISERTENHLLLYIDHFDFNYGLSSRSLLTHFTNFYQTITSISSNGLENKYSIKLTDNLKLSSGFSLKSYGFSPNQAYFSDSSLTKNKIVESIRQIEGVAFTEAELYFNKRQRLNTGLRFSSIGNSNKNYLNFEPRIGYHGIFANNYSISASAGRMTQPIHRVANSGLGFPVEMFVPSDLNIKPETSWNFSLGVGKDITLGKNKFGIKADAWYKSFDNIVEYQDGYDAVISILEFRNNPASDLKKFITQGKGKASGIDFSSYFSSKLFSLNAEYTLMEATNHFADLNRGQSFAASTDIRNSLSLTAEYKLSSKWIFSATWQYRSGKPITLPTQILTYPSQDPLSGKLDYSKIQYQFIESERNNYRMKSFHKLDISILYNYKAYYKYDCSTSFGIYNVYNQNNPYLYFIDAVHNPDDSYTPILKSMSLFPIMPTFNWLVKF